MASGPCRAVKESTASLSEAHLGVGLVKKFIARPGRGTSGSFRRLVATNKSNRWVFVFGFPKTGEATSTLTKRSIEVDDGSSVVTDRPGGTEGEGGSDFGGKFDAKG